MQTSGVNTEYKHSKIKRFSTLNEQLITFWSQHYSSPPSLSTVNKFSDLH